MKVTRDNIVATDPKYAGVSSWTALNTDDSHEVLKASVERCASNGPLRNRFANIRSTHPHWRERERQWLIDLLDTWFFKQWNNKKNQDLKKMQSPAKKRRAEDCPSCSHPLQLVCVNPDCTDCVFSHFGMQVLIRPRTPRRELFPNSMRLWKQ